MTLQRRLQISRYIIFKVFFFNIILFTCLFAQASPDTLRPTQSEKVMPLLNAGWGGKFQELRSALNPKRDYITWMIETPRTAFDMRSPDGFRQSILGSKLFRGDGAISHMMVAWQCHDSNGVRIEGATGMTGENKFQSMKMLLAGWGISAMLATFHDGELNTPNEVNKHIKKAEANGLDVAHLTMEVPRKNCQQMLEFLKSFIDHPNKPATHFGMAVRPLNFEGGGCGSFASALLSKAEFLPHIQSLHWRTAELPAALMGARLHLPDDTDVTLPPYLAHDTKFVWPGRLKITNWNTGGGPKVEMVDPEASLFALRTIALDYVERNRLSQNILKDSGFAPRVVHSRRVAPQSRTGWSHETIDTSIDENFDGLFSLISQTTHDDMRKLEKRGMKSKPVYIGKYWGLVISSTK